MAKQGKHTFNDFKKFKGSQYSGMKVGATHKWYYDKGEWRERKLSPEEWDVYYETVKRRAGKAPKGTGAPVGTEYNWLIIAHQRVEKMDANSYMTCLDGKKFKVAHKRASKGEWNIKEKAQRKKVVKVLKQIIEDIENEADDVEDLYTVGEEDRFYGLDHKSKAELYEVAKEHKIPGRSKMDRAELLKVAEDALHEDSKEFRQRHEKKLTEQS